MTMMRRVSAMKFSRLMGGITHTRLLSSNTGTQQVGEAFVSKVPPCKSHYESATAAHRRKRPVVYPNSAAMLGFDGKDEGSGGAEEARSEAQQLAATSRVRSQAFRSRLECNNKSVAATLSATEIFRSKRATAKGYVVNAENISDSSTEVKILSATEIYRAKRAMAKETGQSSPKRTSTPKAAQDLLEEADESLENPSRPRWGLMAVGVTSLAAGIHQFTDIDGPFVLKSFFE